MRLANNSRDRSSQPEMARQAAQAVNIVIAGSRSIPPGEVGKVLVSFLAQLPSDQVTIHLRRGMHTESGQFEKMTSMVCDLFGIKVEWHVVEPIEGAVGRQLVFARDLELVEQADLVLCFTATWQAYDLECGTTALAQKALEAEKVVYHWALPDGPMSVRLIRVGEHDPEGKYARLVKVFG
jgi:hypothetical protein